jgi:hypothetical protein
MNLWNACTGFGPRTATVLLLALSAASAPASDEPRAKAVGPANHAILSDTLSGSYFVAAPLKQQYDRLLSRLEALKRELDEERVTGAQATARLKTLGEELRKLRDKIEESKVLVPAAKVHAVMETTTFDLGPEGRLVITADQVKLVASKDAKVHCVLEKIYLSPDDKPAGAELAAIKLVHGHGPAPEIGGPADDVRGKASDTVTVEGLTYEQGNRQITLEAESKGGGASMRSVWRRHAALTVHVPKCNALVMRGCLRGLDVQGIPTSLVVTSSGYRDRDYNAQFRIHGVRGKVTVLDFPVNLVEDIDGDVSITTPHDFANSGTQHANNSRLSFWYRPLECRCANLRGSLHARFGRMSVHLEGIRGRIDVENQFGDTTLALSQPLAAEPHRLSSVAGRLEVNADPAALGTLPVVLATHFGTIRTNTRADEYPAFSFGASGDSPAWRGFRRVVNKGKEDPLEVFRVLDVLNGNNNPPGLVVKSQAGAITFNLGKAQ